MPTWSPRSAVTPPSTSATVLTSRPTQLTAPLVGARGITRSLNAPATREDLGESVPADSDLLAPSAVGEPWRASRRIVVAVPVEPFIRLDGVDDALQGWRWASGRCWASGRGWASGRRGCRGRACVPRGPDGRAVRRDCGRVRRGRHSARRFDFGRFRGMRKRDYQRGDACPNKEHAEGR